MHATVASSQPTKAQKSAEIKRLGLQYWQQLWHVGIPLPEARKIAAAMAKYDTVQRPLTPEERYLVIRYSPLICRAQLWKGDRLL